MACNLLYIACILSTRYRYRSAIIHSTHLAQRRYKLEIEMEGYQLRRVGSSLKRVYKMYDTGSRF